MSSTACDSFPASSPSEPDQVARFRIRHGDTELELPPGEFVIGRSTQCNLTLDDALVSRRHARIVLESTGLFIEDLGSRNGFMLNGKDTRDRSALRHLDRVRIGNHDIVIIDIGAEGSGVSPSGGFCRMCGSANTLGTRKCAVCGASIGSSANEHATVELSLPPELRRTESGSKVSAFALVGAIASKALALGRLDEGERMLAPLLEATEKRLAAGEVVDPQTIRDSIEFATKLLDGSNAARWVSFVLHIHTVARRVPEVALVDQLHDVVRRCRFADSKPVVRLIEAVSGNTNLSPADRFVIKRLESLQRVISA